MRTKGISLLISLIILSIQAIYAEIVPVNIAEKVAKNFYFERANSLSKNISRESITISSTIIKEVDTEPVYYVFNIENNNGFIIIAAEDRVYPLLGYAFKGLYNETDIPIALQNLMESYKKQIISVRENNLPATIEIDNQWKNHSAANTSKFSSLKVKGVAPLISTRWSQGQYYNALCPADASGPGGHALVGCVAVAMGQIMKYHETPTQGNSSHSYVHPTYGTLSANFGATTYNWAGMPNYLTSHDTDVAVLLYHCGVGVNMYYGPSGSGSGSDNARYAMVNYFKYTSSTKIDYKDGYVDTTWEKLIRIELDAFRPLYYAGANASTQEAHAFVCDGYQGTKHFHFNWGWGGYADGYFYLTSLNPAGNNFNSDQHIIMVRPTAVGPFCSGLKTLNKLQDTISDGSGLNFYNSSSFCRWLISPPGATSITINFLSFNTEDGFDFLKVYDGSNTGATLIGKYSGSNLPPTFTSSTGNILLMFNSDQYIVDEGWSLIYTANNVGVEENNKNFTINIYPNPSDGNFTLNFSDDFKSEIKIRILDITGRELKCFNYEKPGKEFIKDFSLKNLEAGIYLILIETEKKQIQRRLIIN
ncbi:MAG: C10 family peptidase [Saprospiraceae bacterium]|nr:C10 family peptidase [Saprospiraceae bacterium]